MMTKAEFVAKWCPMHAQIDGEPQCGASNCAFVGDLNRMLVTDEVALKEHAALMERTAAGLARATEDLNQHIDAIQAEIEARLVNATGDLRRFCETLLGVIDGAVRCSAREVPL